MTPSRADALKLLTLDLISPARPGHRIDQHQIDALTDTAWTEILRMARQHRIGPLMRWQLQHAHPHIRVPKCVADALTTQHKRWTARAMAMQRELLRVHGILEAAGIPHVFLKGTYLAYCVYPHPALRPLRDLDILIPPERLMDARAALIAGGLSTVDRYERVPESVKDAAPHLPPLLAGNVSVELHKRIFHLKRDADAGPDLTEDPGFWERCVTGTVAGTPIEAPSPTDQMLHIIVHGVYDHQLANGPLLLSDVALLVAAGGVDWGRLDELAQRTGRERGVALARALVQRYWAQPDNETGNSADGATVPLDVLDTAAMLLLREHDSRQDALLLERLRNATSLLARARILFGAICPPRTIMASVYPVDEHSPWLWLWYPAWWWRQGRRRIAPLLAGKTASIMLRSSTSVNAFQGWLTGTDPPHQPPGPQR
jgi:hypothetical protein